MLEPATGGVKAITVRFLIPTLNEEATIGPVLEEVTSCTFARDPLVIDGNSSDATARIARDYGAMVVIQQSKGKGNAIREALGMFSPDDAIVMIDGDLTYDPREAKYFLPYMKPGVLVNGSRFRGQMEPHAMPGLQRVGNLVISIFASLVNHHLVTDLLSGMKGFIARDMIALNLTSPKFELETEMMVKYLRRYHVVEVPITYRRRLGTSKLNLLSDAAKDIREIVVQYLAPGRSMTPLRTGPSRG